MNKKIVGIFVFLLFIAPFLNCINGIALEQKNRMIISSKIPKTTCQDTIFSDDFNDNEKDNNKWTEIMNAGEWYERNYQVEFQKYEIASSSREGIESKGIPVSIKRVPLKIECIMDSYVDNYPDPFNQWIGQPHVMIVDADDPDNHFIDVYYRRDNNLIIVKDSSGYEITLGTNDEFRFNVVITITNDGYSVDVGQYTSGNVPVKVFPEKFTVKLRLFIYLNGDYSQYWWCAGFDDVIITGKKSIPKFINNAIFEGTSYATVDDDEEPPVTNLYFDTVTCEVTLLAIHYPLNSPCVVKATYYKIDSGDFEVYTSPFILPEGTHTVYFYSEDICDNKESVKSKTLTCDTTPPTVSITSPREGWLYLFGSPIFDRPLGDTTLCIGKVPVQATADDHGGSGVNKVLFSYKNESGWADTAPYEDVFRGRVFGDLTISVTAIDNLGHESDPVEMTIKCYSLG